LLRARSLFEKDYPFWVDFVAQYSSGLKVLHTSGVVHSFVPSAPN
jgi:hypothetical protein